MVSTFLHFTVLLSERAAVQILCEKEFLLILYIHRWFIWFNEMHTHTYTSAQLYLKVQLPTLHEFTLHIIIICAHKKCL